LDIFGVHFRIGLFWGCSFGLVNFGGAFSDGFILGVHFRMGLFLGWIFGLVYLWGAVSDWLIFGVHFPIGLLFWGCIFGLVTRTCHVWIVFLDGFFLVHFAMDSCFCLSVCLSVSLCMYVCMHMLWVVSI
jgi:hypothetical protein